MQPSSAVNSSPLRSRWAHFSSIVAEVITDVLLSWKFPVLGTCHPVSPRDHTRIIGIDEEGNEVVLQGFHATTLIPGFVQSCVKILRWEHPELLIGVLDRTTGEMDWS